MEQRTPDYSEFETLNEDSTMTQLTRLARAQVEAEAALAEAEKQVLIRKKELEEISEKQLPELMDSLGLETFTTTDGRKIGVKEKVRASIPKAQEGAAFEWIRSIGSGKMIKRQVGVQLAMGEDEIAAEIVRELEARGLDVTDKQGVHNSTLVAFVRRRLEAGEEVPLDKISVFRQRVSKVE